MTLRSTAVLPVLALLVLTLGCGDGGGGDGADGGGGDAVGSDAASGSRLDELIANHPAMVQVTTRGDGTTGDVYQTDLHAELRAAALPMTHVEVQREGSCVRLASDIPFCDPECGGDTLCTADDTCTAIAPARSAGTLTAAAGGETLAGEPTADGIYGAGLGSKGGPPLFPPGADLTASAPGADFPGFSVTAKVPETLVGVVPPADLREGTPYRITWTPADPGTHVTLRLIADLGHNPTSPSIVVCDAPDEAGELEVPVALTDAHVDRANWSCGDCFPSQLLRYRVSSAPAGEAAVRLLVGSGVQVYARPAL